MDGKLSRYCMVDGRSSPTLTCRMLDSPTFGEVPALVLFHTDNHEAYNCAPLGLLGFGESCPSSIVYARVLGAEEYLSFEGIIRGTLSY